MTGLARLVEDAAQATGGDRRLPVTALTCALALPAEIAVTQRKSPG